LSKVWAQSLDAFDHRLRQGHLPHHRFGAQASRQA